MAKGAWAVAVGLLMVILGVVHAQNPRSEQGKIMFKNESRTGMKEYARAAQDYMKSVQEDWQVGILWAKGDSGAVDCPQLYGATYPECIFKGGRSCLMSKALDSAKANNCSWAFQLTLITQCHNGAAAMSLAKAGQDNVCGYEKTIDP